MKRTYSVLITLLILLSAWTADAASKPNVLFIAIDDLRPELGCYGSPIAKTPNLDTLAKKALLFQDAYCNVPVCGASRASLLTGLQPIGKKRFVSYLTRADKDAPDAVTLPQIFKQAGYTTLSNGKIFHHPGDSAKRSWSQPAWRPKGPFAKGLLPQTRKKLSKRGRGYIIEAADVNDSAYPDGMIAAKTIADLERLKQAGKPFFLACGFMKPHLPFYAPKKYWDLYDPKTIPLAGNRFTPKGAPPGLRGSGEFRSYHLGGLKINSDKWHLAMKHGYLACTSYIDAQIGHVLKALGTLGLADNTIVVVWGDHGFHLGEHNFWGKHNTLEHAARIPLMIKAPKAVLAENGAGKKTKALVESVDIFPTLCDLAKLPKPKALQGKTLIPLFKNQEAVIRDSVYCRYRAGDAVFTAQYAYTRFDTKAGGRMLFDHTRDPEENRNVVNDPDYKAIAAKLDKLLDQRIKEAAGK